MAIGVKMYAGPRCLYFESFLSSANSAKVSGHVASHTRGRPVLQGVIIMSFGLLPSVLKRPWGSSRDGVLAVERERWIFSLMAAWQWWCPLLDLQLRLNK